MPSQGKRGDVGRRSQQLKISAHTVLQACADMLWEEFESFLVKKSVEGRLELLPSTCVRLLDVKKKFMPAWRAWLFLTEVSKGMRQQMQVRLLPI